MLSTFCRKKGRKLGEVGQGVSATDGDSQRGRKWTLMANLSFRGWPLGRTQLRGCVGVPPVESGLLGGLWASYRSLPTLAVPWGTMGELLAVGVSTTCSGPSCQPGGKAAPLPGQRVQLAG